VGRDTLWIHLTAFLQRVSTRVLRSHARKVEAFNMDRYFENSPFARWLGSAPKFVIDKINQAMRKIMSSDPQVVIRVSMEIQANTQFLVLFRRTIR
tara:strand:- start:849 stop:1136 length:288 start_codon:yes stop_codon:yes gene_type:complete